MLAGQRPAQPSRECHARRRSPNYPRMQRLKRNVSLGERIYRYRGSRDFEAAATRALIVFTLAAAGVASYIQYASSQGTLGARSATPSISARATASASSPPCLQSGCRYSMAALSCGLTGRTSSKCARRNDSRKPVCRRSSLRGRALAVRKVSQTVVMVVLLEHVLLWILPLAFSLHDATHVVRVECHRGVVSPRQMCKISRSRGYEATSGTCAHVSDTRIRRSARVDRAQRSPAAARVARLSSR